MENNIEKGKEIEGKHWTSKKIKENIKSQRKWKKILKKKKENKGKYDVEKMVRENIEEV